MEEEWIREEKIKLPSSLEEEESSLWEKKQKESNRIYSTKPVNLSSLLGENEKEESGFSLPKRVENEFVQEMEKIKLLEESLEKTQNITNSMVPKN